jgi:hypothetical protein
LGIVHKDLGNHQSAAHSFRNAYRLSAKHVRDKNHLREGNVHVDDDVEDVEVERMKFLALAVSNPTDPVHAPPGNPTHPADVFVSRWSNPTRRVIGGASASYSRL